MSDKNKLRETYVYGTDYWKFYNSLSKPVQDKIDWVINLIRSLPIIPEKYFKYLIRKRVKKRLKMKLKKRNVYKKNIMKNTVKNKLVSWDDHLDRKYGKPGSAGRIKYEEECEAFKIGVLIQEARKQQNLTQKELAEKAGTTKNYISRIENDASDIRLSTLMRIVREGLGGRLTLSFEI